MIDTSSGEEVNIKSKELRIFYVDDDPNDRVIVEHCLEMGLPIDFTLTTAPTAKECIEQLEGASFDLLIVDYFLPDMTGPDVSTLGMYVYLEGKRNTIPELVGIYGRANLRIVSAQEHVLFLLRQSRGIHHGMGILLEFFHFCRVIY